MEKEMAKVIRSWGSTVMMRSNFVRKFVWDFVRNHYVWFVHKFYMGLLRSQYEFTGKGKETYLK